MSALLRALRESLPPGVSLRERQDADLPFLARLYASTREEELRPVPWPQEQKDAFLADQFTKQHTHYLENYPGALWLLVEKDSVPIGRIYIYRLPAELRVMDIAFVAAHRNKGLGTRLLQALLQEADRESLAVTLHVEPYNPAMRLYRRLGFVDIETRGYYQYMRREPSPTAPN